MPNDPLILVGVSGRVFVYHPRSILRLTGRRDFESLGIPAIDDGDRRLEPEARPDAGRPGYRVAGSIPPPSAPVPSGSSERPPPDLAKSWLAWSRWWRFGVVGQEADRPHSPGPVLGWHDVHITSPRTPHFYQIVSACI